MKKITVLGIALLVVVSLVLVAQDRSQEPPPGIYPEMWVPLAENYGVALSDYGPIVMPRGPGEPSFRESLKSQPQVRGTLMIKVDGIWHKLYSVPPPVEFHPLQ